MSTTPILPPVRKILIIHGLSATSRSDWFQDVAGHFRNKGCGVLVPDLPRPHAPNLNSWVRAINESLVSQGWNIDGSLSIIAHSTGCLAALRFIEGLPEGSKLGPIILVAGFPAAVTHPLLPMLLARRVRPMLIRPKLSNLLAVHSTNDWRVPYAKNTRWFKQELNAQIVTVENAGHFIGRHGWSDWSAEVYRAADLFLGV